MLHAVYYDVRVLLLYCSVQYVSAVHYRVIQLQVVGSVDAYCMYYTGVVRVQRNHLEHIDRMDELVVRLLQNYANENQGRFPAHIIYFRDGVAETQCQQVRLGSYSIVASIIGLTMN